MKIRHLIPSLLLPGLLSAGASQEPAAAGGLQNPYWPMANKAVAEVARLPENGLLTEKHGGHAFWLAWGSTSPHSTFADKPLLREKLVRVWDAAAERLEKADAATGNMWNLLPALDSLLMLQRAEAFPEATLAGWKAALRPPVEKIRTEVGGKSGSHWVSTAAFEYPNADAQHAAIMQAASLVYAEPEFAQTARAFAHGMRDHLYAPGEWRYYRDSTPAPVYHGTELMFLGRYYQLSRDPEAAELIRATKDYYPFVFATENAAEYTSAPWWKQIWNSLGAQYHATEIAAWLCGDGMNRTMADRRAKRSQPYYWVAYAGEAWEEGAARRATPEALPEAFIIEAPAITGIRGRFGNFSFVGSRGKQAAGFGGCLLVDRALAPQQEDGYLQFARMGITIAGRENRPYAQRLRFLPDPSRAPVPGGHVIGEGFAALAARFQPVPPTIDPNPAQARRADWEVVEQWLFTPRGIVGILEARALRDRPSGLPEGIVRLGPLRRPHEWDRGGTFRVGNLHGRFLRRTGFELDAAETPDPNGQDRRLELQLRLARKPPEITAGQRWSYAVYLAPVSDPAASLVRHEDGSLSIALDGSEYRLMFSDDRLAAEKVR